jgi:hypothetical protein
MKSPSKTAIAMFGGATALALTIGFGAVGVNAVSSASPTTQSSSSVQAPPKAAPPAGSAGVHIATLTGCVAGLDC